jgi:hypothetical protein
MEDALDKKGYFERVAKIAQYVVDKANEPGSGVTLFDRLSDTVQYGPNPFDGAILPDGTLLLQMERGCPSRFHTPLGAFIISGGASATPETQARLVDHLKEKFGLIEVVPGSVIDRVERGPIYAVTKDLDGNSIPIPQSPLPSITLDYPATLKEWSRVKPDIGAVKAAVRAHAPCGDRSRAELLRIRTEERHK